MPRTAKQPTDPPIRAATAPYVRRPHEPQATEPPTQSPTPGSVPPMSLMPRLARGLAQRTDELQALAAASGLYAGLETRADPTAYRWDGRRRSGSRRCPFVLFQYTLAGRGLYTDAGGPQAISPGRAFVAVIPSDHVYQLPPGQTWTFFWVIFHHPYAVERVAQAVGGVGRALTASPVSPVVSAAADVFDGACRGGFEDPFDRESAVLRLMLELCRHFHERSHPATERDTLLADTRRYVLERLSRRVDVSELARRHGMSRSHFSHHFRDLTGRPPAHHITDIRLAEAARLLTSEDLTLKQIAAACGFADANHLCKSFRRRYHLSPGTYRRQGR